MSQFLTLQSPHSPKNVCDSAHISSIRGSEYSWWYGCKFLRRPKSAMYTQNIVLTVSEGDSRHTKLMHFLARQRQARTNLVREKKIKLLSKVAHSALNFPNKPNRKVVCIWGEGRGRGVLILLVYVYMRDMAKKF